MTHPMEKAFQEWDAKDKAFQRELNIHVCRRWDELMTEGKHGHYETLLAVCRSAISFWRNRAEAANAAYIVAAANAYPKLVDDRAKLVEALREAAENLQHEETPFSRQAAESARAILRELGGE